MTKLPHSAIAQGTSITAIQRSLDFQFTLLMFLNLRTDEAHSRGEDRSALTTYTAMASVVGALRGAGG